MVYFIYGIKLICEKKKHNFDELQNITLNSSSCPFTIKNSHLDYF